MSPRSTSGTSTIDDPTDLDRKDYVAALKRTLKEVKDDDVPGMAAGVAFKIFLSLFPALLAAVAVFSIVTTVSELREWLGSARGFLPDAAIDLIDTPLKDLVAGKQTAAGLAAVAGVAAGLWAATGAAISLMKALSRAYDVAETRKFVKQRLVAFALTLALLIALAAIVGLLVAGPQIQDALLGELVPPVSWALAAARFVLAVLVLVVLFAFVYWIGPNRDHPSWVWISPGAVLGVVGWLVASGGFTLYAQTAGSYAETYGAIAGVAVLLIWLQLSMLVILVGAEFNAEVERTRALHLRVNEGAGFALAAPAGSLLTGDQESGATALQEAHTESHTMEIPVTEAAPTVEIPPPPPPAPPTAYQSKQSSPSAAPASRTPSVQTSGLPSPGTLGAIAAAASAVAVFLGLARRRARR